MPITYCLYGCIKSVFVSPENNILIEKILLKIFLSIKTKDCRIYILAMKVKLFNGITPGPACKASWMKQPLCAFVEGFCLLPVCSNYSHICKCGKIEASLKYLLKK